VFVMEQDQRGGVEAYSIDCAHTEMMNVEPILSIEKIVFDVFARLSSRQEASPE
jgi:hypothetical protein